VANAGPTPGALSSDGQALLIPVGATLEVWDAATAKRRFAVPHEYGRGGFCASSNWIATGAEDGRVQLWSARSGAPGHSFRAHAAGVQALYCSETRLLSIGDYGWDARLWDLSGSLNPEPVEPLPNQREHPAWVKVGADARLPDRLPALADLLWSAGEPLKLAGFAGFMLWCCAVYWWFRRDID
jgi:WD40 repeat protein